MRLFEHPGFDQAIFKGGTTLSKECNLIRVLADDRSVLVKPDTAAAELAAEQRAAAAGPTVAGPAPGSPIPSGQPNPAGFEEE